MRSILVVDDMPAVREPIALVLRRAGFEVRCATDGQDALTQAAERRPDLVLLDLMMPRMDGLSVLRVLRARADTGDVPVILLSASSDREHVLAAAKMGVRDYLIKSEFKLSEMLARVRKYLNPPAPTTTAVAPPGRSTRCPGGAMTDGASSIGFLAFRPLPSPPIDLPPFRGAR